MAVIGIALARGRRVDAGERVLVVGIAGVLLGVRVRVAVVGRGGRGDETR